jgi:hypothetical protein
MRGTLILCSASILLAVAGCGVAPPPKPDPIPPELVPDGFTAADCQWDQSQPAEDSASGAASMGTGDVMARARTQEQPKRRVACHRTEVVPVDLQPPQVNIR